MNENITKAQLSLLLDGIKSQLVPNNDHFYIYGESKRLAMPFVYILLRGEHTEKERNDYLDSIMIPAPFTEWKNVYTSNSGLAKLHNTRAFVYSALAITAHSKNPTLVALQTKLAQLIKILS